MAETDPATPEVGTEPQPVVDPGQPEGQPEPAQPSEEVTTPLDPGAPTDWRKAYESSQRTNTRLARRMEEFQGTTRELTEALRIIRTGQEAIAKATMPPEQADALIAAGKGSEHVGATRRAIEQATNLIAAQQRVLKAALEGAGLDTTAIDWANDAASVEDWADRVHTSVQEQIAKGREGLLKSVSKAVKTNTDAEKVRLKDEQRRTLKDLGADKIDTASGSASTFAQRLATMDPNSKEFAELTERALAGQLRGTR